MPGLAVFPIGLVYGIVHAIREGRASLRAVQLRLFGLAFLLGLPALYLAYLVMAGRANPVALLGVAMLVGVALFNLCLARVDRVPSADS